MFAKTISTFVAFSCVGVITPWLFADDGAVAPPVVKTETPVAGTPASESPASTDESDSQTVELEKALADYITAFNQRNVDALVKCWTADGVFTLSDGTKLQGHAQLTEAFKDHFADMSEGTRLTIPEFEQTVVSPKIARETGTAVLYREEGEPETSRYTAYYIRENDTWKLESVDETDVLEPTSHYTELQPLEWLVGEWSTTNSETGTRVTFSNDWSMNRNFITSKFAVYQSGEHLISGVQIIGWDQAQETLRSWIFDSEGGFGNGSWAENDGKWSLRVLFQTNEGEKASAINIYSPVDENTYLMESVGRQRGGQILPSLPVTTVTRQGD